MTVVVCTIAARNYLPRVRVLARSFLRHHPAGRVLACIVDDPLSTVGAGEPFEVIRPGALALTEAEFRAMTLYYDVTELSTALKPWVLEHVLASTGGPVLYLDPDCMVFDSLRSLVDEAAANGIVLVPHVLSPIPRDGRLPDEASILGCGVYNCGFFGLGDRPHVRPFLEFWKERLRFDSIIDQPRMLFTDQRWIDFVPAMYPHHIARDPGCDVAYWNAHERELAVEDGRFTARGRPLRFVHFSGFDPARPALLSTHAGERPRLLLSEQPVLRELCRTYAAALDTDGGRTATTGYLWDTLPGGIELTWYVRRFLRDAYRGAGSSVPPRPVGDAGGRAVVDWMVGGRSGVPRLAARIWSERPDLQLAFPAPEGRDAGAFATWMRTWAAPEYGIDRRLAELAADGVEHGGRRAAVPLPPATGRPAVEVVGFVGAELGIGEAARRLVASLGAAGVRHGVTGYHRHTSSRLQAAAPRSEAAHPADIDVVISCVNADLFPRYAADLGPHLAGGRHRIGYWWWELEDFPPDHAQSFGLVDEVWCSSEFTRRAIARQAPVPVVKVPVPVVEPVVDRTLTRADVGFPDGYVFLFVFDHLSVARRKNPLGLIEAFRRAFAPGEGPVLIVKSINGERKIHDLEATRLAALDRPDVVVTDGYVREGELGAMIALSDCYVSLHRSEGLGLTIADAMALGVPVIATAYGGNLEFTDERNSLLVPARTVEVGTAGFPYPADAHWGEPDLDVAAEAMRRVVRDPGWARERAELARADLLDRFSPARCGAALAARIDAIRAAR